MKKMSKNPVFIIDDSVMKEMIEGNNKQRAIDMLDNLVKIKNHKRTIAFTPMSALLAAISISNPKSSIENLQKILNAVIIVPDMTNFKDEKSVREHLIKLANRLSGGKNDLQKMRK
jgi:hypothetical protein